MDNSNSERWVITKESLNKKANRQVLKFLLSVFSWAVKPTILVFLGSVILAAPIFFFAPLISDAFLGNLVTLDSIVIAALSFSIPTLVRAARIDELKEQADKIRKDNPQLDEINDKNVTVILSNSALLTVLPPIIAVVPFFVSAVLALLGMFSCGFLRLFLSGMAFWLMLGSFGTLILITWRIGVFLWKQYWLGFLMRHPEAKPQVA